MKKCNKSLLSAAIAMACGGHAAVAGAQAPVLEEITVTATKRSESARDIPYNISAVTGDVIESFGVTDIGDLGNLVPGIAVTDVGARTGFRGTGVTIRGLATTNASVLYSPAKNDPTVGMYVGDTPLYANLQLMDVERVEVLRGPQGTLYGGGSMGGNIRYVLTQPSTEGFEGRITAGVGKTASASDMNSEVELVLNAPLTDNFAVRLNASSRTEKGFMDFPNVILRDSNSTFDPAALPLLADPSDIVGSGFATTSVEDADDSEALYLRGAARYDSDNLTVTLNIVHQELESDASPVYETPASEGSTSSAQGLLTPLDSESDLISLEIEYDMGFATLTSSTAQTKSEGEAIFDLTGLYTNFSFYQAYYGSSPRPLIIDHSIIDREVFTQELRLTSTGGESVDWMIGAFYNQSESDSGTFNYFPGYDDYANACFPVSGFGSPECGFGTLFGVYPDNGGVPIVQDLAYFSTFADDFDELAVFGEVTYHISDDWRITGGVRWFDHDYGVDEVGGLMFVPGLVASTSESTSYSDSIFKVNTSYSLADDHQVYATWSEGFRRGGANALGPFGTPETATYAADTIENREIGFKGVFGGRVEYTVSLYDIDWNDVQNVTSCSALALTCYITAGNAESKGIETEITAQLTNDFRISAGFTYTDASFKDVSPTVAASGVSPGEVLPGTPETSGNLMGTYSRELNNGWWLDINGSVTYSDDRLSGIGNNQQDVILPSYTLIDASVRLSNETWSATLFFDNLSDEDARITALSTVSWGPLAPSVARRPRTVGLRATYSF